MNFKYNLFRNSLKVHKNGDLVEFPRFPGLLIFPISMAKIEKEQTPRKIFDFIVEEVLRRLWKGDPISVLILYSADFYERHDINLGKDLHNLEEWHKKELKKLIAGVSYLEKDAYSFLGWDFFIENYLDKKKLHNYKNFLVSLSYSDETFEKYLKDDMKRLKKGDSKLTRQFLLEECAMFYMILKEDSFNFKDIFTKNMKRWIFLAYAGPTLKIFVYLHQKNLLNIKTKSKNIFQDTFYDFKAQYLYKYLDLDLDKYGSIDTYAVAAKENSNK